MYRIVFIIHPSWCLGLLLLLLLLPAGVAAQQPAKTCYSICKFAVQAPTHNADNPPTPLTDLAGIRVYASSKAGGPYDTLVANVSATEPGAEVQGECFSEPGNEDIPDGDYWLVATAYDHTVPLNESVYSNEVSLCWDTMAPGAVILELRFEIGIDLKVRAK